MKKSLLSILSGLALVGLPGCAQEDDTAAPPVPSAPAVTVSMEPTAAVGPGSGQEGQSAAAAPSTPVEPQLAPIQIAIQTFEQQNKRMPLNIPELVESGILKELPPPPAGKIYFIDHATKQVRLGGGP